MSAKDTADAILRDFRTSMAGASSYLFDSDESAQAVLEVLGSNDWMEAGRLGAVLFVSLRDFADRRLAI